MPYITLKNEDLPGIRGLLHFRPETAKPLGELCDVLLRGPSTLTMAEREIIASAVSWWNQCHYCHSSHGAAAAVYQGRDMSYLDAIKQGLPNEPLSPKMRALLHVAKQVQESGRNVTEADIAAVRNAGATDLELHDTVLIAAAFCMFNRYVDGLGTWCHPGNEAYRENGERIARQGYSAGLPK